MKVGDRVIQPYPGMKGVVTELMTLPTGQKCAWVKFDRKRSAVMRIVDVLKVLDDE